MKKGVLLMVFLVFAGVIAVLAIGVLSCLDWWKKHVPASQVFFWGITVVLLVNMFFTAFAVKTITIKPLKEVMIFLSAITFIVLIYTSLIMTLKYIISFLMGGFVKPTNHFYRFIKETHRTVPILLVLTMILGIVGYIHMGQIVTKEYEINTEKKSKNKQLTAAVIADTHIGISAHKGDIDEIISQINDIKPDVVLLLGDIFDENTSTDEKEYFAEHFKDVKSKYGSFYIYGNHDDEGRIDCEEYIRQAGIKVLADDTAVIGGDITLIGMNSEYAGSGDKIERIIKDKKVDVKKPVIVLKHEPLGLQEIADAGADVSMHGHTHGEQFPLTYIPFSFMNDMMCGTKKFGEMTAFTTQGAGGWGFHFKLPASSEVAKVTINFGVKD